MAVGGDVAADQIGAAHRAAQRERRPRGRDVAGVAQPHVGLRRTGGHQLGDHRPAQRRAGDHRAQRRDRPGAVVARHRQAEPHDAADRRRVAALEPAQEGRDLGRARALERARHHRVVGRQRHPQRRRRHRRGEPRQPGPGRPRLEQRRRAHRVDLHDELVDRRRHRAQRRAVGPRRQRRDREPQRRRRTVARQPRRVVGQGRARAVVVDLDADHLDPGGAPRRDPRQHVGHRHLGRQARAGDPHHRGHRPPGRGQRRGVDLGPPRAGGVDVDGQHPQPAQLGRRRRHRVAHRAGPPPLPDVRVVGQRRRARARRRPVAAAATIRTTATIANPRRTSTRAQRATRPAYSTARAIVARADAVQSAPWIWPPPSAGCATASTR